jgi:hypothetical protein
MSEEANSAVATTHGAVLPIRMIAQDCIQRELILTNKRSGAVVLVPILAKREKFRDGYNKTAKFSVTMLIVCCISSSYSLDTKASRGRARIFHASALKITQRIRATDPRATNQPISSSCLADPASSELLETLLGKKNQVPKRFQRTPVFFLFQVVDPFT